MSVNIATILDVRRIKEDNKYPVKRRVNYRRVTRNYQTIFDLSQEDYNKLAASRISPRLQHVKNKLRKREHKAENLIKEMKPFAFLEFDKKLILSNPLIRQVQTQQFQAWTVMCLRLQLYEFLVLAMRRSSHITLEPTKKCFET